MYNNVFGILYDFFLSAMGCLEYLDAITCLPRLGKSFDLMAAGSNPYWAFLHHVILRENQGRNPLFIALWGKNFP